MLFFKMYMLKTFSFFTAVDRYLIYLKDNLTIFFLIWWSTRKIWIPAEVPKMKVNIQERYRVALAKWSVFIFFTGFFSCISENKSNKKVNYSYPVYKLIKCSILIPIFLVELVYAIFQSFHASRAKWSKNLDGCHKLALSRWQELFKEL